MVNILIIDDNIDFAKNLMIYINSSSETLRVCAIATDGMEALKLINEIKKIDILILDLKLPKASGVEIIKRLSIKEKNRFKKSIIIISGENYLIQNKILDNEMIYCVLHKLIGFEEICRKIEELTNQKEQEKEQKSLKEKIIQELLFLGYDMSHKGTKHLIEIIHKAMIDGKDSIYNLNKEVYPNITNHSKKVFNVKTNINRATNNMFYNCQEDVLKKYFYLQDSRKPSTKMVINTIIMKVRNNKQLG